MLIRRATASVCALVAALPAFAQDIELDDVVVTGTDTKGYFGEPVALGTGTVAKTGDLIAETPRSVSVVTAEQMQQRGARSVEDALKYSPGVNAGQWGLDNRSDWSLVRGFSPTTLHDGLPSRFGFYNNTKPEPFLLNSVEVLRGPSSGLYGSGSVGGVINTTSKTAAQDTPNLVQLQYGSFNRAQLGVDFSGDGNEDGTLRYRFVGVLRDASTQVDYSQDDTVALAPSFTWRPSDDTELTVLANYQKTNGSPLIQFASIYGTLLPTPLGPNAGQYLDPSLFVGEPGFDMFNTEQASLTAMFKHRFNDVWSMNANARVLSSEGEYQHAWWAFDNFATGRYNPDGTVNRTFYRAENTLDTISADAYATAEYSLGALDMRSVVGASLSRAVYDSDIGYGAQVGPIGPYNPVYAGYPSITVTDTDGTSVDEWGIYNQNRAMLGDNLFVDFGVRFANIKTGVSNGSFGSVTPSAEDSAWTGNFALMYRFDNGLAPYLSWSQSFEQDSIGTDRLGNAFDPTRGEQYEVGLKYQPAGTNTLISAAAFDLTKSNILVTDPIDPTFQVQTGEAKSKGLELELFHSFGEVSVQAAYTFLDTQSTAADGSTLDYISQVPEQMASVWVNYTPSQANFLGLNIGLGARLVGDSKAPDGLGGAHVTPSYTLFDAAVSFERNDWLYALNINNLTDERVITTCEQQACYFGEGRNVMFSVSKTF
jgi:iron complex outermembrane receptor protein